MLQGGGVLTQNSAVKLLPNIVLSLSCCLYMQGAKFDSNSLFRIALLYKHPESLAELDFLGGHVGGDAKRRRHG
jgi:hypothetical protein